MIYSGSKGVRLADLLDAAGCIEPSRVQWIDTDKGCHTRINGSTLEVRYAHPMSWDAFINGRFDGFRAGTEVEVKSHLLSRAAYSHA